MAQLRGKLPTDVWIASEDLLTSAVFGTLKNLPDPMTAALLSRAPPLEGSRPPVLSPPLQWRFWPSWDICEPDVVLEDDENLCVIEAKLYSDFGEDAPAGSQLRREWTDGLRRAQDAGKEVWLIALTNHTTEQSFTTQKIQTQNSHPYSPFDPQKKHQTFYSYFSTM
jgi:hypothetical protein